MQIRCATYSHFLLFFFPRRFSVFRVPGGGVYSDAYVGLKLVPTGNNNYRR